MEKHHIMNNMMANKKKTFGWIDGHYGMNLNRNNKKINWIYMFIKCYYNGAWIWRKKMKKSNFFICFKPIFMAWFWMEKKIKKKVNFMLIPFIIKAQIWIKKMKKKQKKWHFCWNSYGIKCGTKLTANGGSTCELSANKFWLNHYLSP